MTSHPSQLLASKKRPRHVLPQDFSASFSDKTSFYSYMKEQL